MTFWYASSFLDFNYWFGKMFFLGFTSLPEIHLKWDSLSRGMVFLGCAQFVFWFNINVREDSDCSRWMIEQSKILLLFTVIGKGEYWTNINLNQSCWWKW